MKIAICRFTVLCNGSPSGTVIEKIAMEGVPQRIFVPPSGNKHFSNAADYISLTLSDVRWYDEHLLIGLASLMHNAMRVGITTPWCCWVGDWPQAPAGLLHWTNRMAEWEDGRPTNDRRAYSLMTELVPNYCPGGD